MGTPAKPLRKTKFRQSHDTPELRPAASTSPDELKVLKGQFLASLNHEIRTPLSGILGMTDLLLETILDTDQQDYVRATRNCAQSLLQILDATLELSALTSGNLEADESEFALRETLEAAVAEQQVKATTKELKLICTLPDDLPEVVIGDALRIRQLLSHLLDNAIKFTASGEVEFSASSESTAKGLVLTLSVRDTGVGIGPEEIGDIFESFQQVQGGLARQYPGLGLGLALAQRLARLLGGQIVVDSEPGTGTVFTVFLPVRAARDVTWTKPFREPSSPKRILVVEDNEVARQVATYILKRGAYEIRCARNGPESIRIAAEEQFDLILMDLQMPGMSGIEATAEIRKLPAYARTPILALTANSSDDYRGVCREAGMQDFLTKPVEPRQLLAVVARYLRKVPTASPSVR